MPDAFLTVGEIADLLKVNQQTVRNWIDRRELPAVLRTWSARHRNDLAVHISRSLTAVSERLPAIGVDGCPAGWIAAIGYEDEHEVLVRSELRLLRADEGGGSAFRTRPGR